MRRLKPSVILRLVLAGILLLYFIALAIDQKDIPYPGFSYIWPSLAACSALSCRVRAQSARTVRIWRMTAILCLSAFAIVVSLSLSFILAPLPAAEGDFPWLIVLGGGIRRDGSASLFSIERCQTASDWLLQHPQTWVLVSGGKTVLAPYPESLVLRSELIGRGIDAQRIYTEDEALNTIENLRLSIAHIARIDRRD